MANDERSRDPFEGADAPKEKNKGRGVAEHLQSPRKKRKNFVLVVCGRSVSPEVEANIAQFLKANYKGVSIAHPKTTEDFLRLSNRQVVLIIFDDEFLPLDQGLSLISDIKRKKGGTALPVLFLTRQVERLITSYNKILLPFHEADEYIDYAKSPPHYLYSKIRAGLIHKNRRKSRRYKVNLNLNYFSLTADKNFPGRLADLSIHGALLTAEQGHIFRAGDQLKLHIPFHPYLPPTEGDYLKISAKVRRVHISGNQAGISFEHMSDKQQIMLMKFLTEIVNSQNARKPQSLKLRGTGA